MHPVSVGVGGQFGLRSVMPRRVRVRVRGRGRGRGRGRCRSSVRGKGGISGKGGGVTSHDFIFHLLYHS